jgi:hypothetical protein
MMAPLCYCCYSHDMMVSRVLLIPCKKRRKNVPEFRQRTSQQRSSFARRGSEVCGFNSASTHLLCGLQHFWSTPLSIRNHPPSSTKYSCSMAKPIATGETKEEKTRRKLLKELNPVADLLLSLVLLLPS